MADAAQRAGRDPGDVALVAVCKTFPAEVVAAAYAAGLRDFGENRVEEALVKLPAVRAAITGPLPTWHMVGHVQSRKAREVVAHFDIVHSVDRLRIARRLGQFVGESQSPMTVLLECNVSGEANKSGFDVADWRGDRPQREAFFAAVEEILALPGTSVQGLMTMAPLVSDPQTVRPVFASLRGLLDALRERFATDNWRHLSMGMTDDFEVAIEEGATMVRIGRAIFGPRTG